MIRRFLAQVRDAIGKGFHFIAGALSEAEGCPSSKRLFFGATILAVILFCAFDLVKHGFITREVIELMNTLVYVTAAAYGVTRVFAEKNDGAPAQPKTQP